ncbi:MAG: hypothetical protein J1E84_04355 [Muribaculaceae bacterium]|nr:hypothetical protein [Muribaculaceae bacterium]
MRQLLLTIIAALGTYTASADVPAFININVDSPKIQTNTTANIEIPDRLVNSVRLISPAEDNSLKVPDASTGADEWIEIGEGTYKDILFSDLFGKQAQTLKVKFEQNVANPTIYRIPHVYENMDLTAFGDVLTYNPENATPMVFHIFNDSYAYFDEFDTGIYMNNGTDYTGEIRMLMQGTDLLDTNTVETLYRYLPEALCQYRDGNITLGATFMLNDRTWANILGLVYVTGTPYDTVFRGNNKGDFFVTLPDAQEYDPDADWEDVGMAKYTDTFTEWLYASDPVYDTWEVLLQQNTYDTTKYRLVNPYAGWTNTFSNVSYDKDNNYYMNFTVIDYDGYSLVGIPAFYTGLNVDGYGEFAVSNQAADIINTTDDFLSIYYYYPGSLGMLQDGVITYPAQCVIDMTYYQNFFGYFGAFDPYGNNFVSGNSKGNFRIEMPSSSGINAVESNIDTAPAEFYNLQGIRVYNPAPGQLLIQRRGADSKITIYNKY